MRVGFVVLHTATTLRRPWLLASLLLLGASQALAQGPTYPLPNPMPQPSPTDATGDATAETTPDTTPPPVTAQEWFRRGENVYRVGRYQEAIDAWTRAFELDPRPRIQYNLAQAYERLGRLEDAVTALQFYLAHGDPNDDAYPDANARLAALRARVEATGVMLRGGPNGGEISIDGQAWGYTPRPDRITLAPGSHLIEIHYPDGSAYRSTVATPAGQVVTVQVNDADITVPQVITVQTEAPISHAMLYTGIGMAGVGVGFLIYGIERQAKVSTCEDPDNYCRNLSAGQTQRSVGLAAGVTLTAAGAALVVVDLIRHRGHGDEEPSALTCAPLLAGATCRLRF